MSDDRKIFVDDDWKEQARREKEKLAEQEAAQHGPATGPAASASFTELVNMLVMQTLVGLGMVAGPGGQPYPPNLEMAKHFIDMLQVLEDKTRGNLNAEEKKLLDGVLYEIRMHYVRRVGAAGGAGIPGGGAGMPGGASSGIFGA